MSLRLHVLSASCPALIGGVLSAALMAGLVSAQSLGEVARKEEERRKTVTAPAKVYTNESIKFDQTVPSEPSTAGGASSAPASTGGAAPATPAPSASAPAADAKRDEASWKKRRDDIKNALDRAQTFADALQSRINGLTGDFSSRDDPAQRAKIATDRQKALTELERVKKDVQTQTKALADLQEEARKAGVPAGWLR